MNNHSLLGNWWILLSVAILMGIALIGLEIIETHFLGWPMVVLGVVCPAVLLILKYRRNTPYQHWKDYKRKQIAARSSKKE